MMERKIYAVFVAGGSGSRMGGELPKQFIELQGKTILQRTIENFIEAVPDIKVILVLPKAHFSTWKNICAQGSFVYPHTLVEGGITRFQSVRNALEKVPCGAIVSIHDGVRPFASPQMLKAMFDKMDETKALVPAVPVVDTLRSTDPSVPDPDRSKTVAVQTPQIFWSEELKAAYSQAYDVSFTDDASVAAKRGVPITLTAGERFNIKITTPEDLVFAEAILRLKRS